jgi:hypothetical protein
MKFILLVGAISLSFVHRLASTLMQVDPGVSTLKQNIIGDP